MFLQSFWIQIHYIIQTLQNGYHGHVTEEENMELGKDWVVLSSNGYGSFKSL